MKARVAIFAKYPAAEGVKSRLAAQIGTEDALAFYRSSLEGLVRRLSAHREWELFLAVTPDESMGAEGWPHGPKRIPQGPGDLGERMSRFLVRSTPESPVIICGSDIPDLMQEDIAAAVTALRTADLVIGPSPDGGYWLIGASRPPPDGLFDGVRWSTRHAHDDTIAHASGLRIATLRELEDIDDAPAYRRWKSRVQGVTPCRTRRPVRRTAHKTGGSG
jgi:rSAM/selenodomain-associated transferase 1